MSPASQQSVPVGFGLTLKGCPASSTELLSFKFRSSIQAVTDRFATVGNFLAELQAHIGRVMGVQGSRLVVADFQEDDRLSTAFTPSGLAPSSHSITVTYRLLPAPDNCVGCSSPLVLKDQLHVALADPTSEASKVLTAVDAWIEDFSAQQCAGKTCADTELCVQGVCISLDDGTPSTGAKSSVQTADSAQLILSQLRYDDQLTGAAPLSLLANAPIARDPLVFQSAQAVQADEFLSNSYEEARAQNFYVILFLGFGIAAGGIIWFAMAPKQYRY